MTKLFSRPRCQDVIGGSSVPGAEVGNDYLTGKNRKKPHYAAPELPKKKCKSQWHVETLGFQLRMTGLAALNILVTRITYSGGVTRPYR